MQIVRQTLTVGTATNIDDPAQAGGNPSVACQIQNASAYQLTVLAAGDTLSIQPFTAQTVEISGQPMNVTALTGTGTGACNIVFVFLLTTAPNTGVQLADGTWIETPPQQDGPLTAAAIAAATQGSVDKLDTVTGVNITAGTGTVVPSVPIVETLKAYQTLVVQIDIPFGFGNTAGIVSAFAICDNGQIAFPSQQRSYPTPPGVGAFSIIPFILPCAYSNGDTLEVNITNLGANNISGATVIIFGLTQQSVLEVIAPTAMPLGTYQVGGSLLAKVTTAAGSQSLAILGAPPSGFQYALKRFTNSNAALECVLNGTIVSNYSVIGGAAPIPPTDNLHGLLVNEALAVIFTAAGACTAYLWYDLVPVQTVQ